ncbi:MAG: hypothetical protein JST89_13850 [Cyanobacteria bacterium SZAS-4]|nr:hypothetical protein [Cyanobacteria bacterium SZAS-4]
MPKSDPTKPENLWFKGHRHPWLSFAIGFCLVGAQAFVTDLYLFWLNRPDDLDRGPHFRDDLTFALIAGPIGGCIGYVLGAVLQCFFDFLRYVFSKSET